MHEFGFESLDLKADDFLVSGYVIQLGNPPNRIDLLTSVTGLNFNNCYLSKVEINLQGTNINFIDLESLKKNKRAVGRHQDLADLENLE